MLPHFHRALIKKRAYRARLRGATGSWFTYWVGGRLVGVTRCGFQDRIETGSGGDCEVELLGVGIMARRGRRTYLIARSRQLAITLTSPIGIQRMDLRGRQSSHRLGFSAGIN